MYPVVLLFVFFTPNLGAHLPPEIEICKASDPDFKNCLISSAEKAIAVLANGNEELGLPPLDPLSLTDIVISAKPGPVSIDQKYTNSTAEGISAGEVQDFGIDLEECKIRLNHTFSLRITTNYELKGQFHLLPIDAKGKLIAEDSELGLYILATCKKTKKDEKSYIRVLSSRVNFRASNSIKFDYGANGYSQLNEELQKFIEDSPLEFFKIAKADFETLWNITVFEILNTIFKQIPVEELFKD